MKDRERSSSRLLWLVAALLALGAALVVANGNDENPEATTASVWEIERQNARGEWIARARDLGLRLASRLALFVPFGLCIALALPRRRSWAARLVAVFLPAAALGSALTVVGAGWAAGPVASASDLLMRAAAATGAVLGASMGTAASGGVVSFLLFFPKLLVVTVVGVSAGILLATSPSPFDIDQPQVGSEDRRHLVRLFRGHNPMKLRDGETRTANILNRDVELLLASGLSLVGASPPFEITTGPGEASLKGSAHVPVLERYLNLDVRALAHVERGEPSLSYRHLRIGAIGFPEPSLRLLSTLTETLLRRDETLSHVLAGIDELRIGDGGIALSYRRMDPRGDFLSNVLARLGPDEDVLAAARVQIDRLARLAPTWSPSDGARFEKSLRAAFTLARERSRASNPIVENEGAILALATVLGHPRIRLFAGLESETPAIRVARRSLPDVTLRGRRDWTQHFFVSAGLMQLSSVAVSDAVGVLKEELDAEMDEGGSGFSFADLLADRAGTLFSRAATADVDRAETMQERLSGAFDVADLFPSPDGLTEGISDADLTARYGGVGGDRYRSVIADIEARLSRCSLLN